MIGLILPTHTYDPEKLVASIKASSEKVHWYIFHHSTNQDIEKRINEISQEMPATKYLYRVNRGLSKSWNEGIHKSLEDKCEFSIILNDDLHFINGGFDVLLKQFRANPEAGLGYLNGREVGGSHDGQIILQGMACFAIRKSCIDKIGYFDENFSPAYYEDIDYQRRSALSKVPEIHVQEVIAEHHRSSTTRSNPDIARDHEEFCNLNRKYYENKWGGPHQKETYVQPFNNPDFDLRIDWNDRHAPYTEKYLRGNIIV